MRVHTLILYVSLCVWWVGVVGVGGSRGRGWVVGDAVLSTCSILYCV